MNYNLSRCCCFILLLCCCIGQYTWAQLMPASFNAHHFGVEDGLSNNRVIDAVEDKQGMLWLATLDGLNRFDGYEFLVYGNRKGTRSLLSGSRIDDLAVLPDGRLFIKYYHDIGYAELLNPLTENVARVVLNLSNGLKGTYLKCYEHGGRLYFVAIDKEKLYVHRLDSNGRFTLLFAVPHSTALDVPVFMQQGLAFLPAAESGFYWMLDGYNGLRYVDAQGRILQQHLQGQMPVALNESPALLLTANHQLFAYSHHFDEDIFWTLAATHAKPQKRAVLLSNRQDNAPVLKLSSITDVKTFELWYMQMQQLAPNADWLLPSYNGQTLYVSNMLGFSQITTPRNVFKQFLKKTLPAGMAGIEGRGMVALPNQKVLAATEKNGFFLLDITTGKHESFLVKERNQQAADSVFVSRSVYLENDSIVWTSEYSRLQMKGAVLRINVNARTYDRFLLDQFVNHICWLGNNRVVAITEPMHNEPARLVELRYTPKGSTLSPMLLQNITENVSMQRPAFTMLAKNGHLWYATDGGVYEIDIRAKKILQAFVSPAFEQKGETFPLHTILPVGHAMVLHESADGKIWVGTNGGGINIIDPQTATNTTLTKENGLADNRVCGILYDKKNYWFSTWHGISMYDPRQKSFQNFYETDGLTNNECNRFSFLLDGHGFGWIGGLNGFNVFDPVALRRRFSGATMILASLSYHTNSDDELATITANFPQHTAIRLPAAQPSLTVKLAFSDLGYTSSNSYSYLLQADGATTPAEWKSNGNSRSIIFDNLPPGNYTLQLKGYCGNGSTAVNTIVLHLSVADFFYNTWWFRLLIVLLIVAIVYVFYHIRLAHALSMDKMRIRISSDLHDEVGGLLSGVAYQMELLAYQAPAAQKDVIQQMASSNRYAMSRMRDVVWAIDARKDTLGDLIVKMKETAQEQLSQAHIETLFVQNNVDESTIMHADIRHNIFLFFREVLTNILKHAQASEVEVNIAQQGGWLKLVVKDSGIGFVQQPKHSGQGLSNMELRASNMKGRWQIHTNEKGTTVVLSVPV